MKKIKTMKMIKFMIWKIMNKNHSKISLNKSKELTLFVRKKKVSHPYKFLKIGVMND